MAQSSPFHLRMGSLSQCSSISLSIRSCRHSSSNTTNSHNTNNNNNSNKNLKTNNSFPRHISHTSHNCNNSSNNNNNRNTSCIWGSSAHPHHNRCKATPCPSINRNNSQCNSQCNNNNNNNNSNSNSIHKRHIGTSSLCLLRRPSCEHPAPLRGN
mmetsp:Transcript_54146/g.115585  ORF Transcript_54146/g.115585 Transcript_54146/m.115585 type:complete len:155 (-) Transcript_54146:148-612(-)